jgi:hypothetical protein
LKVTVNDADNAGEAKIVEHRIEMIVVDSLTPADFGITVEERGAVLLASQQAIANKMKVVIALASFRRKENALARCVYVASLMDFG